MEHTAFRDDSHNKEKKKREKVQITSAQIRAFKEFWNRQNRTEADWLLFEMYKGKYKIFYTNYNNAIYKLECTPAIHNPFIP